MIPPSLTSVAAHSLFSAKRDGGDVSVFWDPNSGFIKGRVCREGMEVSADVCGLPKRRVAKGELPTVRRYFSVAAMSVRGRRIEVWPRLLGGMPGGDEEDRSSLRLQLRGKKLEDLLLDIKGIGSDPGKDEECYFEMDRRFEIFEEWKNENDLGEQCRKLQKARDGFLLIAEKSEGNTFIKAMNELIYSFEMDSCKAGTSGDLKEVFDQLERKISDFQGGDIISLEKLTQAFGVALRVLIEHYRAGHLTKLLQTEGPKEIWKKADDLEKSVQKKKSKKRWRWRKTTINLDIAYNLQFIREGVKRLKTIEPKTWHIMKKTGKPVCEGMEEIIDGINIPIAPIPVPVINVGAIVKAPITVITGWAKLIKDPSCRMTSGWYKGIERGLGKPVEIDLATYRQHVKSEEERNKKIDWHWHYKIIGYIKDVIKYLSGEVLDAAEKDLNAYLTDDRWKKNHEIQIRLYQVLCELYKSGGIIGAEKAAEFNPEAKLPGLKNDMGQKIHQSINLVDQDIDCEKFWIETYRKRKKIETEGPAICKYDKPVSDDAFIPRVNECNKIEQALVPIEEENEATKIVVISGLRGVGKTQLARKFVQDNYTRYGIVYTFHGQSAHMLANDYAELGRKLGVGQQMTVSKQLEKFRRWLLIFDNIDEQKAEDFLKNNLPKKGGCVLITSRRKVNFENFKVTPIQVDGFKRSDSISFLRKMIPGNKIPSRLDGEEMESLKEILSEQIRGNSLQVDDSVKRQIEEKIGKEPLQDLILDALAHKLDDLPLALVQAGAYMNRHRHILTSNSGRKKCDAFEYLKSFRTNRFTKGTKAYHKETVRETWERSRECIRAECDAKKWSSPFADEALILFSFLSAEKIPEDWIADWLSQSELEGDLDLSEVQKDIVEMLGDGYSMVFCSEDGGEISIHRLMQQVVRESLDGEIETRNEFIKKVLVFVKDKFQGCEIEDASTHHIGQQCLPHAISIIQHAKENLLDKKSLEAKADLYAQIGRYIYNVQGMTFQAEEYLEIALGICRGIHGESHLKVANILNSLGNVRRTLGGGDKDSNKKTTQARNNFLETLRIYKEIDKNNVNANNRKMLFDSLVNLGSFSRELGADMDAIVLYEEAWEIAEDIVSLKKSATNDSEKNSNEAGSTSSESCKFFRTNYTFDIGGKVALMADLAEAWERVNKERVKNLYEEIARFGEEWKASHETKGSNDDDAITLSRFGDVYCKLKDNDKAKEFGQLACKCASSEKIKALTATKYGDILTQCDGLQEDVLACYKQAVRNYKNSDDGNNRQDVVSALEKLGDFQLKVGNKSEAIKSYEQAREICEKVYGEKLRPNKALILKKLGGIYFEEEIQRAMRFYEQALKINTILYGESHPEVGSVCEELGKIYKKLGNTEKANECKKKAKSVRWWGGMFLSIYISDDSLKNKILVHCANLQALDLRTCGKNLQNPDFSGCTSLQTLDLSWCDNLQDPNFSGCSNLQTLYLSGCNNLQSPDFSGCTNLLQTLDLSWCDNLQDPNFSGCTSLQTLNLRECKNLQNPDFSGCTNLQRLILPENITDTSLNAILLQCPPSLQTLDLRWCENLQSPDFSGCTNLQTLMLPINVTDLSLKAILSQCPLSLQTLDLRTCGKNLQNPDFSGCTSLQTLILPKNITDLSLNAILSQCPSSLQTLDLIECKHLRAPDLSGCTSLQTLILPKNITDLSLNAILSQCSSSLQTLDLRKCKNLQNPDFSNYSNLKSLNLQYCYTITTETFQTIRTQLPNCKITPP